MRPPGPHVTNGVRLLELVGWLVGRLGRRLLGLLVCWSVGLLVGLLVCLSAVWMLCWPSVAQAAGSAVSPAGHGRLAASSRPRKSGPSPEGSGCAHLHARTHARIGRIGRRALGVLNAHPCILHACTHRAQGLGFQDLVRTKKSVSRSR